MLIPAATVQKIVSEILPAASGVGFAKEARDLLIECCVEFITLISSEANEISEKEAKKTIACDHITKALEQLGFSDYVAAVQEAAAEHKEVQKVRFLSIFSLHTVKPVLLTRLTGAGKETGQVRQQWYEYGRTCSSAGGAICASKRTTRLRLAREIFQDTVVCGFPIAWFGVQYRMVHFSKDATQDDLARVKPCARRLAP